MEPERHEPDTVSLKQAIARATAAFPVIDLTGFNLDSLHWTMIKLNSLRVLRLTSNQFLSLTPGITKFERLQELHMEENRFKLVPSFLSRMNSLTMLRLSGNRISTLSNHMCFSSSLKYLDLDGNTISVIPDWIGKLKNLQVVIFSRNKIVDVPDAVSGLRQLRVLKLDGNMISSFPQSINTMKYLELLDLDGNSVTFIPGFYSAMQKLVTLTMAENKVADIPPRVSNLSSLNVLDVRGNGLSELPQEMGLLTLLVHLRLSYNRFTHFPECTSRLKGLTHLDMSHNEIKEVPGFVHMMTSLYSLILDKNPLRILPPLLANMSHLVNLSFDTHSLTDKSHQFWSAILSPSQKIDISSCDIVGVPLFVCRFLQVRRLQMENNQITAIPDSFVHLKNLKWINLSHNFINHVPLFFWDLPKLQWVDLSENVIVRIFQETRAPNHVEMYMDSYGIDDKFMSHIENSEYIQRFDKNLEFTRGIKKTKGVRNEAFREYYYPIGEMHPESSAYLDVKPHNLSKLIYLDLTNNLISDIGPGASELTSLRVIHLGENPIGTLPMSFSLLHNLEMISLGQTAAALTKHGYADERPAKRLRYKSQTKSTMLGAYRPLGRKAMAKAMLVYSATQAAPQIRELSLSGMDLRWLMDMF